MTYILTYSFVPAGLYIDGTGPSVAVPLAIRNENKTALRMWENYGDFLNAEVSHDGTDMGTWATSINTRFFNGPVDGPSAVLANERTNSPFATQPRSNFKSMILFDSNDTSILGAGSHNLKWLTRHELGHGVGGNQNHNDTDPEALMYPTTGYFGNYLPKAAEQTPVSSYWGAPTTFAQKMGAGKPLGDVYSLYRGLTNTNPNAVSTQYWNNAIKFGSLTRADLAFGILPAGVTDTVFVQNLYTRALGRTATSAEVSYWVGQIPSQGRHGVAVGICTSADAVTYRVATRTTFWLS